ncbi:hypothetical protein P3545_22545 [Vibrio parahaemolyticus]|nr:hypothetical protein [Vibrio parahaemolyticus]
MRYKRNYVGVAILASLMAGCGGEEQSSSSEVTPPEQPVSLNLKDASLVYPPSAERHEVNLNHYVTTSNNSPFKLTRVEALSSDAACQVVGQTDTQFYVAGDTKKACDYRYFAESANGKSVVSQSLSNTSNSALVRLATTEQSSEAELPPLTNATLKNTPVRVDLRAQFDAIGVDISDWVLSEAVTLPYNHDALVDVDVANQTLTYTPESDFTGIDRILFSFTDAEQNPRLGQVDIAVSVEANQGLIVEENIIYPTPITYDEKVNIDVSPYVTSPDGDDYQLVYLQSFDAEVIPTNSDDLYNKSFTLLSNTLGSNDVTFAVSDHNGSYSIGIVQLEVEGNTLWDDIIHNGIQYIAPITSEEAEYKEVIYEKSVKDIDYPTLDIAHMNAPQAELYCSSIGAEIATYEQWSSLVDNTNIKDEYFWPVQYAFIVNKDGIYNNSWSDGSYSVLNPESSVKPLCVRTDNILLEAPADSDFEAVANGIDEARVAVQLFRGNKPIVGASINVSINEGGNATLDSTVIETDENGIGVAALTNFKAEDITVTFEYIGSKVESLVTFFADKSTAELAINVTTDHQPYLLSNTAEALLIDANDNPISGEVIDFRSESHANEVEFVHSEYTNAEGKVIVDINWITDSPKNKDEVVRFEGVYNENIKSKVSILTFVSPKMCGSNVDDRDHNNAAGYCLKVREIEDNSVLKWVTSSPSETFLKGLGYTSDNSADNSGKTYSFLHLENGFTGPAGVSFGAFRQDGEPVGQFERYCSQLADIEFLGLTNWRRPHLSELESLGQDNFLHFGWPTVYASWSQDMVESYYHSRDLYRGITQNGPPEYSGYGSCVSVR